jgi:hypothetical protein
MLGGQGRYTRKPLVLDTSGDESEGAGMLDEVASGLKGLTIVSSANGVGWVGVKGRPERLPLLAPAQTRGTARTFSSSLSILSALTEPPSIHSGGPPIWAVGGWGGFDLWLPSTEGSVLRNTQGKLRPMQLVYVAADDGICFGMIGTKCFCRSKNCRTKAHGKKFSMGTMGGWLIPGKSNLTSQPNAFIRPFLDALKITEDRTWTLKHSMEWRTTDKWEDYILKAQEEWEELPAHILLGDIQEGSLADDDDNDNDSNAQIKGDLCLMSPSGTFAWTKNLAGFEAILKRTLGEMYSKDSMEAVEALQAAVCNLEGMMVETRRGLRDDALEMLTHVNYSIAEIVAAIDQINKRGCHWASEVGDIGVLREDSGLHGITLVEAVLKLVEKGAPQDSSGIYVSQGSWKSSLAW